MTWHRYPFDGEPTPCENVEEFVQSLVSMPEATEATTKFIFRGHSSNRYKLIPSALRVTHEDNKSAVGPWGPLGVQNLNTEHRQQSHELQLVSLFCKMAHEAGLPLPGIQTPGLRELLITQSYSNSAFEVPGAFNEAGTRPLLQWPPDELLPVLGLMQHYGMPTRLLDWSTSPLTAAYFGLNGVTIDSENNDTVKNLDEVQIWALSVNEIETYSALDPGRTNPNRHQRISKRFPYRIVRSPSDQNPNLRHQQGVFTVKLSTQEFYENPAEGRPMSDFPTERIEFHDDILSNNYIKSGGASFTSSTPHIPNVPRFYRLSLPTHLVMPALRWIQTLGYSGNRLFDGYYGVVKSASEHLKTRI